MSTTREKLQKITAEGRRREKARQAAKKATREKAQIIELPIEHLIKTMGKNIKDSFTEEAGDEREETTEQQKRLEELNRQRERELHDLHYAKRAGIKPTITRDTHTVTPREIVGRLEDAWYKLTGREAPPSEKELEQAIEQVQAGVGLSEEQKKRLLKK